MEAVLLLKVLVVAVALVAVILVVVVPASKQNSSHLIPFLITEMSSSLSSSFLIPLVRIGTLIK